jgi:hypothetical protein
VTQNPDPPNSPIAAAPSEAPEKSESESEPKDVRIRAIRKFLLHSCGCYLEKDVTFEAAYQEFRYYAIPGMPLSEVMEMYRWRNVS